MLGISLANYVGKWLSYDKFCLFDLLCAALLSFFKSRVFKLAGTF